MARDEHTLRRARGRVTEASLNRVAQGTRPDRTAGAINHGDPLASAHQDARFVWLGEERESGLAAFVQLVARQLEVGRPQGEEREGQSRDGAPYGGAKEPQEC